MEYPSRKSLKAAFIGAISGALVFCALGIVKGQGQQGLTVHDAHSDPKQYVGSKVSITGMVSGVRADTKWLNGHQVPCIKLNLYEVDPAKNKKTGYYVYISLPTSAFKFVPNEGDLVAIEGTLKWPWQFAMIDE
jgi:hypothetical protein